MHWLQLCHGHHQQPGGTPTERLATHALTQQCSAKGHVYLRRIDDISPHRPEGTPHTQTVSWQGRWHHSDDAAAAARYIQRHSLRRWRQPLRRGVQSTAIDERQSSTATGDSHRQEHAADAGHRCFSSLHKQCVTSRDLATDRSVSAGRNMSAKLDFAGRPLREQQTPMVLRHHSLTAMTNPGRHQATSRCRRRRLYARRLSYHAYKFDISVLTLCT